MQRAPAATTPAAPAPTAASGLETLAVTGVLGVRGAQGIAASERWLTLLGQLAQQHSIVAAARAAGLSYKAAWDAIDTMNNLASGPLVERVVGGRGGGGTRLTTRGEQLVRAFRGVQQEHAAFLQRVNAGLGGAAPALQTLRHLAMQTSARNRYAGTVTGIRKGVVNDEIELTLAGGETLTAVITRESSRQLQLRIGTLAIALVKASWIILMADPGRDTVAGPLPRVSARNCLRGTVSRITPGAVNTEVVVELKGGNTVAVTVTRVSARSMQLVRGSTVSAIFKASSVILARLD